MDKLTFSDLGLPSNDDPHDKTMMLADGVTPAKWVQFVEPERDGAKWCDWDDAEDMLVQAARSAMRGAGGIKATSFHGVRDEDAMTLSLELIGG